MQFNHDKLRGKIREIFKTQQEFAKVLGISTVSLNHKLSSKVEFTQKEICKSVEILELKETEIPLYFFNEKVQKIEHEVV